MPVKHLSADRFEQYLAVESSLARYRDIVDDWPGLCDAVQRPLPTCLWANPLRIGVTGLIGLLAEDGLKALPIKWQPSGLRLAAGARSGRYWWYCAGLAHAQEESSQLPVTLLDLSPGQRVLDLCAAPGGKTAQIACALGNRGTLIANDRAPERIKALIGNLDRLGILNVTVTCCDGVNFPATAGQFDRVLVDAPCSGEGTLRRNPVRRINPLSLHYERFASRQRALLRKAVQRCRPGGRIVYSTCTFAPEENELVVADLLDEQRGRLLLRPVGVPGLKTTPGITEWQGRRLDPALAHCLRLWPHTNDTGGFFVAVLERDVQGLATPTPPPAQLASDPSDEDWVNWITKHYGLPAFSRLALGIHRQTRRGLHLVAADHAPPTMPPAVGSGCLFLRTNLRPIKLTTAGALLLGPFATAQRLALTSGQRDAYLARKSIWPIDEQTAMLQPGQVLVTYRGVTLGLAIWHRSGLLESLFPTRWSGCAGGGSQA